MNLINENTLNWIIQNRYPPQWYLEKYEKYEQELKEYYEKKENNKKWLNISCNFFKNWHYKFACIIKNCL